MENYGISVVVPMLNEAKNIEKLHQEIVETCEKGIDGVPFDYEIIFVDDGSKDNTEEVCRSLHPLTYVKFRKSFGQTQAMDCGLHMAKYPFIVTMDGDGQNDPADIPNLLNYLIDNDLDVVSGWRKNRKDNFGKRFVSRGANFLRKILINDGIHDSGCSLKIYRKECFDRVHIYGEQHRFIPAILKIRGFKIGEIEVNHRSREHGKTKYRKDRIIKGFCDMISVWFWQKYASRPLHMLGFWGLVFFVFSFLSAVWLLVNVLTGMPVEYNIIPFISMMGLAFFGVLMFILGIMSECLMKIHFECRHQRPYDIKKIVENEK